MRELLQISLLPSPPSPPPLLHDVAMPPPLRRAAAGTTILVGFNLPGTIQAVQNSLPGKVIQKAERCGTMLEFWPPRVLLYVREEGKEGKRSFIEMLPHLN